MNSKTEIVDVTTHCLSFPALPDKHLKRENLIDAICDLSATHNVVFVEGQDGIGKTTMLSTYAQTFGEETISLFINPVNKLSANLPSTPRPK